MTKRQKQLLVGIFALDIAAFVVVYKLSKRRNQNPQ